jgi:hypothetical protein
MIVHLDEELFQASGGACQLIRGIPLLEPAALTPLLRSYNLF